MNRTVILKLVSAIAVAGEVLRAGNLIEVTLSEARDLLRRGKAEIHSEDPGEDDTVTASGTVDPAPHPEVAEFNAAQEESQQDAQDARQGAALAAAEAEPVKPAARPRRAR